MFKSKRMMILVSISVVLSVGIVAYGAMISANAQELFYDGGYVLTDSQSGQEEMQYYFNEGDKYVKKYPQKIVFSDVNGNKIVAEEENFIHYQDKSVSAFVKGCFLDLDQLSSSPLTYYNISNKSIMEANGSNYVIKNLGEELKIKNILWKLSDTKYMVMANHISLNLGDGVEKGITGYIEINYMDSSVVRLVNQESVFQTISQDAQLTLDNGVVLGLSNKKVTLNGEEKLSLANMSINADDNVEIIPEETNVTKTEKEEQAKKEAEKEAENQVQTSGSAASSGTGGSTNLEGQGTTIIGGGASGGASGSENGTSSDKNTSDKEEETEEKKKAPVIPTASVTVEAGAIDAEAKVSISDNDDLLTGEVVTRFINRGTNAVVEEVVTPSSMYEININSTKLLSNTEYWVISTATYKVENEILNVTLVQKLFSTTSLGVELSKDFVTNSSAAVLIKVDAFSSLSGATLKIYDANGAIIDNQTVKVDITKAKTPQGFVAEFEYLTSDSQYTVAVEDLVCDSYAVVPENEQSLDIFTLKQSPVLGQLEVYSDKRNNLFRLSMVSVDDMDKGITNVQYQIYKETDLQNEAQSGQKALPIKVVDKQSGSSSIDVLVDETPITRNEYYRFKIVAIFNDNEKTVEFNTPYSDVFSMNSKMFPTMEFVLNQETLKFNYFEGVVKISDPDNTLDQTALSNLQITYTNSIGDIVTLKGNYDAHSQGYPLIANGIDGTGLRSDDTYIVSVYGDINLDVDGGESNGTISNCLIGSKTVKTPKPDALKYTSKNATDIEIATNAFATRVVISPTKQIDANQFDFYSLENASQVDFSLYEGKGTSGKLVATKSIRSYGTGLVDDFYNEDRGMLVTPETFGGKNSDYAAGSYTLQVTTVLDSTRYLRPIEIKGEAITMESSGSLPKLPNDENDAIEVQSIRNIAANTYTEISKDGISDVVAAKDYLDSATTVAFAIKAKMDNTSGYVRTLTYNVVDTEEDVVVDTKNFTLTATNTVIPTAYFNINDGTQSNEYVEGQGIIRGRRYHFTFSAKLQLENGTDIDYPTGYVGSEDLILRSKEQILQKEVPTTKMYLSRTSIDDSKIPTLYFKYYIHDVDRAVDYTTGLILNKDTNTTTTSTMNVELGSPGAHNPMSKFEEFSFSPTFNSEYRVSMNYTLYNGGGKNTLNAVENYFGQVYDKDVYGDNKKVKVEIAQNSSEYVISLMPASSDYLPYLKQIAALKIEVKSGNASIPTKTFDPWQVKFNNDIVTATISKELLLDFESEQIFLMVSAYYDSNAAGGLDMKKDMSTNNFSNSNYMALQERVERVQDTVRGGTYYTLDSASNYTVGGGDIAINSMFETSYQLNGGVDDSASNVAHTFKAKSMITNTYANNEEMYINHFGTALNNTTNYFIPKLLTLATVTQLDPGGPVEVSPLISNVKIPKSQIGIDNAYITFNIKKANKVFANNGIMLRYFEIDSNDKEIAGTANQIYINVKSGDAHDARLTNLTKDKAYGIEIYYKLKDTTEYVRFGDSDNGGAIRLYTFRTLSKVTISGLGMSHNETNYGNKQLTFNYHINLTTGFTHADYRVYRVKENGVEEVIYNSTININDSVFVNDMSFAIMNTPGNRAIKVGEKARCEISYYAYQSGTGDRIELGDASETFTLEEFSKPVIRIANTATNAGSILKVSIVDPSHTIYRASGSTLIDENTYGSYNIRLLNEKGNVVTQTNVSGDHSVKNPIQNYMINMDDVKEYLTVEVAAFVDMNNDGIADDEPIYISERLYKQDDSGISLGDKQISSSSSGFMVTYRNSFGLDTVKKIVYTVYDMSAPGTPVTNTLDKSVVGTTLFKFYESSTNPYVTGELPYANLKSGHLYYVEVQYITSSDTVKSSSFEYQTQENASISNILYSFFKKDE